MKTNNQSQPDVVKKMREIRNEFNAKIMDMTFEEEKAYLKEVIDKSRFKFMTEKQNEFY